jgi:putative ATPase
VWIRGILCRAGGRATAAAYALDWVGLPEAQFALAQATAYIAAAPKSNRAGMAYFAAMDDVLRYGSLPVPNHLRSATYREKQAFGTGKGYVYPHDFMGADVAQQYLPDRLENKRYYDPSDHGYEKVISDRMELRRQAREDAAATGGAQRDPASRPKSDAMKVSGNVMGQREEKKRATAARQKKEASS